MRKRRRFTPEFKAQVVPDVLTGRQSPAEACRKHALSPNLLTTWKTTFLERAHTLFQGDEQRDERQTDETVPVHRSASTRFTAGGRASASIEQRAAVRACETDRSPRSVGAPGGRGRAPVAVLGRSVGGDRESAGCHEEEGTDDGRHGARSS